MSSAAGAAAEAEAAEATGGGSTRGSLASGSTKPEESESSWFFLGVLPRLVCPGFSMLAATSAISSRFAAAAARAWERDGLGDMAPPANKGGYVVSDSEKERFCASGLRPRNGYGGSLARSPRGEGLFALEPKWLR